MNLRGAFSIWGPRGVAPCFDSILWRLPRSLPAQSLSLTFDDGPHPDSTPRLLDVLSRHGLPATFFLIGAHALQYPHLVREIVAAGHALGNHSATHLDGWRCSRSTLWHDMARGSRIIRALSNKPVAWLRPPYGHFTWPLMAWSRRRGQRIVMWDAAPADYNPTSSLEQLIRSWNRQLRSRSIILLHDNAIAAARTPQLLEHVLPRALDRGWQFVPLPASEQWTSQG